MTNTFASFHQRAPRAVSASPHNAALIPFTLFAAIDDPVNTFFHHWQPRSSLLHLLPLIPILSFLLPILPSFNLPLFSSPQRNHYSQRISGSNFHSSIQLRTSIQATFNLQSKRSDATFNRPALPPFHCQASVEPGPAKRKPSWQTASPVPLIASSTPSTV